MTEPKTSPELFPYKPGPDRPCHCESPDFYFHDAEKKWRCYMCGGVPDFFGADFDMAAFLTKCLGLEYE